MRSNGILAGGLVVAAIAIQHAVVSLPLPSPLKPPPSPDDDPAFSARYDEAERLQHFQVDYGAARAIYRELAESGHTLGTVAFARLLHAGLGGPGDKARAGQLVDEHFAALQALQRRPDPRASFLVGTLYDTTFGPKVRQDPSFAYIQYNHAAHLGHVPAQGNLAIHIEAGHGVRKNPELALDWIRRSAEAGLANSQSVLGSAYLDGGVLPQDVRLGRTWIDRAYANGSPHAAATLGHLYRFGRTGPVDKAAAFRYFQEAATLGNAYAQANLGMMYEFAEGTPADETKAAEWYFRAIETDPPRSADAHYFLGRLYLEGRGVPHDELLAYDHFSQAAALGHDEGSRALKKRLRRPKPPVAPSRAGPAPLR